MTSRVVEVNVGGVLYATTIATMTSDADSLLAEWFSSPSPSLATDNDGRYSIVLGKIIFKELCYVSQQDVRIRKQYSPGHPLARMLITVWKAVVDVPCNLKRVVIISQRVVDINQ